MIHHVSLGVSDLERAAAFYDAALAPLGYRRTFEVEGRRHRLWRKASGVLDRRTARHHTPCFGR